MINVLSVRYLHCIIQTYFKTVTFYNKHFFSWYSTFYFLSLKCLYFWYL